MKLSDFSLPEETKSLKAKFASTVENLNVRVAKIKDLIPESKMEKLNDALVIASTIQDRILNGAEDSEIKPSIKRFTDSVKAVFQGADFDPDMREQIKKEQLANVKDVSPRDAGEGKTLISKYPDMPGNPAQKTASAIPPIKIAEYMMRDMEAARFYSAQDAYDGYTDDNKYNDVWPYASASQKCKLAHILQAWGFKVNYDKWEKEADKDYKELEKTYKDIGKGDRKEEDRKINVEASNVDNKYCTKCKKTTKHNKEEGGLVCTECPSREVKPVKKQSILDKFEGVTEAELVELGSKLSEIYLDPNVAIDAHGVPVEVVKAELKLSQYDPMDTLGEENHPQDLINRSPESDRKGMHSYACQGCGDKKEYPQQGEYGCEKCGQKMIYGDTSSPMQNMNPDKMPQPGMTSATPGPQQEMGAGSGTGYQSYLGAIQKAADKNLYITYEAVKEMKIPYAENMERIGMTKVRAKYLIKLLQRENV